MTKYFKQKKFYVSEEKKRSDCMCVFICVNPTSQPSLLTLETGMEGVGVTEINATIVWSAMQLSRIPVQHVSTLNKESGKHNGHRNKLI